MKKIVLFIIFLVVILFLLLVISPSIIKDDFMEPIVKSECPIEEKVVAVRGDSMAPFFVSGEEVGAVYGYYNCNDVLRNDVVLYKYSGNDNLLIKFIKAIPGDRWNLKRANNGYEIVVNDIALLNSEGRTYLIPEDYIKVLELYIKDYPTIPADTYLLLGDKTDGSLDSTSFGLVGKKDIMAKVGVVK